MCNVMILFPRDIGAPAGQRRIGSHYIVKFKRHIIQFSESIIDVLCSLYGLFEMTMPNDSFLCCCTRLITFLKENTQTGRTHKKRKISQGKIL
jgi:hypothetical protein